MIFCGQTAMHLQPRICPASRPSADRTDTFSIYPQLSACNRCRKAALAGPAYVKSVPQEQDTFHYREFNEIREVLSTGMF